MVKFCWLMGFQVYSNFTEVNLMYIPNFLKNLLFSCIAVSLFMEKIKA